MNLFDFVDHMGKRLYHSQLWELGTYSIFDCVHCVDLLITTALTVLLE
jgi:hypothetical protein